MAVAEKDRLEMLEVRKQAREGLEKIKTMGDGIEQAFQEVLEARDRFRVLAEAVGEAIFVHVDGTIILCNSYALELVGAGTEEEVIGKNLLHLLDPRDKDRVVAHLMSRNTNPIWFRCFKYDGRSQEVWARGKDSVYNGQPVRLTVILDPNWIQAILGGSNLDKGP
jgi:PAS domain S-box-containing protein